MRRKTSCPRLTALDTMARMERLMAQVAEATVGTTKVTFRGHEVDLGNWRRLKPSAISHV